MKKILLFDIDNTLLDFDTSEARALQRFFTDNTKLDPHQLIQVYDGINQQLWHEYETGAIDKDTLVNTRFAKLFSHFGQQIDGAVYEMRYQGYLAQGHDQIPGAKALLEQLKREGYRLFAASNGIARIQHQRLQDSGFAALFEETFISEELGVQKPQKRFFETAFSMIADFSAAETVMIGDSLSSDIAGGKNAQIDTVWYNPKQLTAGNVQPTYTISRLQELPPLLKSWR